jgi:hypothetical protein
LTSSARISEYSTRHGAYWNARLRIEDEAPFLLRQHGALHVGAVSKVQFHPRTRRQ